MRPGSTDPQVPGSNAARTFVFIKSGKFLKVRFTPKLFFSITCFSRTHATYARDS